MCDRGGISSYRVKNSTVAANDFRDGGKRGESKREKEREPSTVRRAKFLIYKWSGSGYRTKAMVRASNVLVNEFYRCYGRANK